MDPLEALGQDGPHPEQHGPLGGPVPRRPRPVLLAGQDHQRHTVGGVAHGGVVDGQRLAVGQVAGHAALGAGGQAVADPAVGERAPDHHLVVSPAGAVGVEVARLHAVLDQPAPGRAVGVDRPGGGDVVGGDAVAQHGQHPGALDVGDRLGLHREVLEERRLTDVGRRSVPLVAAAGGRRQVAPPLLPVEHPTVGGPEHLRLQRRLHDLGDLGRRRPHVAEEDGRAVGADAERLRV